MGAVAYRFQTSLKLHLPTSSTQLMRFNLRHLCCGVLFLCLVVPTDLSAQIITQNAFPNIRFDRPLGVRNDGVNDWLYVIEQAGKIKVVPNDSLETEAGIFLDLTDKVFFDFQFSLELGFLGLTFHPEYETNGYFYVYYLTPDPYQAIISRFQRSDTDPTVADPDSELRLIEIDRQLYHHHGGDLTFGPDGYLYISVGDGHPSEDGFDNAQNLTTLLGSILRIDVDQQAGDLNYTIPSDNPFAGNTDGYREEIFAYGLRNPWRFSIDAETGTIWVGNVGERDWEEVHIAEAGQNLGWPLEAGGTCRQAGCDLSDYNLPIWSYLQGNTSQITDRKDVCVTGGYVYRGESIPDLQGKYIYSDCSSGILWSLEYDGENPATNKVEYETGRFVPGLGEDINKELYVMQLFNGTVLRIIEAPRSSTEDQDLRGALKLSLKGPNPFNTTTELEFVNNVPSHVELKLYNMLGKEVDVLYEGHVPADTPRRVTIDASSLSPGVYFCRLNAGGQIQTQQVILIK